MSKARPSKGKSAGESVEELGFEEATRQLQAIIDRMERGEIGPEESLEGFERGMKLLKRAQEILDRVEQRVRELTPSNESGGERTGDDSDEEPPF